jgi:hypothetical protein
MGMTALADISPGDVFLLDGQPFTVEIASITRVWLRADDGRILIVSMADFVGLFNKMRRRSDGCPAREPKERAFQ